MIPTRMPSAMPLLYGKAPQRAREPGAFPSSGMQTPDVLSFPQRNNAMSLRQNICALAAVVLVASQLQASEQARHAVTLRGKEVTLVGNQAKVGEPAPAFAAVANDLSTFEFKPGDGQVWIVASVPSLDTPVCHAETRRFNEEASKLPGVKVLTISMDLPFAQKRWCGAEGIKNLQTVSDYRDRAFGKAYGVYIKENGLLARAVWVIGKDGKVVYTQLVPELTKEPEYDSALAAARKAVDG